jgi:hypothetical protein
MAYSTLPISGVNLNGATNVDFALTAGSTAEVIPAFGPLGAQTFGNTGLRYVFAQAGAAISASTTVCAINTTTFQVAATGGAYTSPGVALNSGDFAWFSEPSV